ncbi:MAG: Smr/MutS family protein [Bacteroidaceae bacterium]|nr:Smr/MutS family protein [Bacteroidaceae bacterium]
MIYPNNFEQKIGFDHIRHILRERCLSTLGKDRVDDMHFATDPEEVNRLLDEVTEFVRIIQEEDSFPNQHFFDVRPALRRATIEGLYMDEGDLFDLRRSLDTISQIIKFLQPEALTEEESSEGQTPYPNLAALASDVHSFPTLIRRIDGIVNKFGKIKDNASRALAEIRRELAATTGSISRTLNSILRSAQAEGIVDKDVNPTVRDGRLVIPVAPALKRRIKGIVHDESATGKTVFIEPAEVVEANNRIRELEAEERREVIRILTEFTDEVRPQIPEILESYSFLAEIDFIRAKGLTAIAMDGIKPQMHSYPHIDWVEAIHPLLQISLAKHHKKVVPLDITLHREQRILIISGPNAGGKSVCLKTVGLLQYMLQCGMLIPVKRAGGAGIFESIFIDIGDEQSIEDDLSTYSSHLLNMKNMMREANSRSLILIDEFGSGTEPLIGGAMAEAVLRRFNAKQAYGVITTHYSNLKQFAENHPGVVNGAMLYDRHQMQALYQLQIGNPGSSFAVEIARKIGLPEEVIADASEIVGSEYIQSDKYLQDIVRDKRYWETKRQNIRQKEKQLETLIAQYEGEMEELKKSRKSVIREAKEEMKQLLQESNARIENTIRTIKEAQAEKEQTRQARQELAEWREAVTDTGADEYEARIQRKMEQLKARQERKKDKKNRKEASPNPSQGGEPGSAKTESPLLGRGKGEAALSVGSLVRIKGQQTIGTIEQINGKNAMVTFGMMRTMTKLAKLEPATQEAARQQEAERPRAYTFLSRETQENISERRLHFKQDIDVRGMRGEEALQAVTYYIDDAVLLSMPRVRILHGTGNGILRTLIRQYLNANPAVASCRDEHVQFGGAGITVVELN